MNAKEMHDLSDDELQQELEKSRETLFKLRFQHATAQLDSAAKLRGARRNVARAMTIINERRSAAVPSAS